MTVLSRGIVASIVAGGLGMLWPGPALLGQSPGGFFEGAEGTSSRPSWTAAQIQGFLPARGRFLFPEPYNTIGIRLTNAADCGGADCILPVGLFSRNINAHGHRDTMLVFLGLRGVGPTLFGYSKVTGQVKKLGPLFASTSPLARHSGDGWYFSASQPTRLYVTDILSPTLQRYDVAARSFETVFDASAQFGPGRYITETASSDDDNAHSATLRDLASHAKLGCLAYREDTAQFFYHAAFGDFGECRIDRSGRFLVIQEELDGRPGRDNLVVDLETGIETIAGDSGPGGDAWSCSADATGTGPHANEVVCSPRAASREILVVTQNMNNRTAPGGGHSKRPRGHLDVTGRYFVWVTNMGGARADAFLVEVPAPLADTRTDATPSADPGPTDATDRDFPRLTAAAADPSGLIAYLKLDEGAGTAAADSSGNGNAGTLIGGAVWTAGISGRAVAVDGVNDYVRINHTPALNAFPLSTAIWFKTTTTTGVKGLVNKYAAGSSNGYQIFFNNGRLCASYMKNASNYVSDATGCPMSTAGYNNGAWHQAALVVDAVGGRLYVDGVQKASRPWTGAGAAPTTTQRIRLGDYGGRNLAAVIDDFRIYNRALAASEVLQLYTDMQPPADTTPPQLSGVGIAAIGATGATVGWATNEPADSQVEYGPTASYGWATTLDPGMVLTHSQAVTGLASATLYHYRVKSRDAAGNLAASADSVFTTLDGIPPSVSLTAPTGGASISGTVGVTANAGDNVAVGGVQFKLDGANLGPEDTTSPYSVSWDSTTASDGSHALTATARDGAGNTTTSATVAVTVANGGVLTLAPQDTFIKLDTTNQSAGTRLLTYTWPDNQVANAILMKFDLSSIPPAATVTDATLQLALVESDAGPESTYTVTAHKVVGRSLVIAAATGYTADGVTAWTPNACCSGGVPLAQADISAPYASRAIDKAPGYKSWSVTALAQEWVASPSTNLGLLLNSDASKPRDRYRTFASTEEADPALRPFLRLTYSLAPDVTPPLISAVLASALTISGATLTWTTNEPSDTQVEFGLTTAYGSLSAVNASLLTAHLATLAGLVPNTQYHYRVRSRDRAGNLAVSTDSTFTTLDNPVGSAWPHEPTGFVPVEETGWEAGTLGNWYRIFTSTDKPITVTDVADSPLGESKALEIGYAAGHVGGGGTELRFDVPSALRRNEIFVGYYVQVSPQWQGHSSAINKMVYLHDNDTGGFAAMWYEMFGSGGNPLGLYVVNQSGGSPPGLHENVAPVNFTRGVWHKVEIYQKQGAVNNGIVRVWVDGVLATDRSDVNTLGSPINNVTISGIWGGVGDAKSHADYMRFDRIRVSRPGP